MLHLKQSLAACAVSVIAGFLNPVEADSAVYVGAEDFPMSSSDSHYAVTVIDRATIRAIAPRSIADVLRYVPGMYVGHISGHQPSIGLHGAAHEYTRRIQVLVDGRTMYVAVVGTVLFETLPVQIEDIEQIEVIRGPSGSHFGDNALQGTINIRTAHAGEKPGTKFSLSRGDGIEDYYAQHGFRVGDTDVSASVTQYKDDGLSDMEDDRQNRAFWVRSDTQLSDIDFLVGEAGYSESELSAGSGAFADPYHPVEQRHSFLYVGWARNYTSSGQLTLDVFHDNNEQVKEFYTTPLPVYGRIYADANYDYKKTGAELRLSDGVGEHLNYSVGVQYYRDGGDTVSTGYNAEIGRNTQTFWFDTTSIYGQLEYDLASNLTGHVGFVHIKSDLSDDQSTDPGVSLLYRPRDNHTFRAGYSTGSRLPTSYEALGARVTFLADLNNMPLYQIAPTEDDMVSESGWLRDIAYIYRNENMGLETELRVYREHLVDLIAYRAVPAAGFPVLPGTVFLRQFANISGYVTTDGVELSTKWNANSNLSVLFNASFSDSNEEVNTPISDFNESSPSSIYSGLISYQTDSDWLFSVGFNRVDSYRWVGREKLDDYTKVDVRIEKCIDAIGGLDELCFRVSADNIDGDINDFYNEASVPSRIYGSVSFSI